MLKKTKNSLEFLNVGQGIQEQEQLKEHHDTITGITDLDFMTEKYQSDVVLPLVVRCASACPVLLELTRLMQLCTAGIVQHSGLFIYVC